MTVRKFRNLRWVLFLLIFLAAVSVGFLFTRSRRLKGFIGEKNLASYDPGISAEDFVLGVNNKYFTLTPGREYVYEMKTTDGVERVKVTVTGDTRIVDGVVATVVLDRVYFNDDLIEETYDWYAQDKDGNVWYFGEEVGNFENGQLINHKGAWEASVDGAKPGIIMLANPKIGESYRQEYYKGQAEDMGEIVSLRKKVKTPYGEFENCLQTKDWSLLESGAEYKYYCPEVGFQVLEEDVSGKERLQLISVSE